MPASSSLMTAEAAKKGTTLVVEAIASTLSRKLGAQYRKWKANVQIESVYERLSTVRTVKTILSLETGIDLTTFYYPTRIAEKVIDDRRPRTKIVNDVSDFGRDHNILLLGTVGQGKSICLRYLASRELIKGELLPLYVELRRVNTDGGLYRFLVNESQTLGLSLDDDTFNILCETGRIMLFLDGFDELSESRRENVLGEIEFLVKKFGRLRVILSSRPGTGAEGSAFFSNRRLAPLDDGEYKFVIERFLGEDPKAGRLINALHGGGVTRVLNTPLMVALLVVRFRIEESVPETELAFYGDLFDLLARRHDSWKGGFRRQRKSSVSDSSLRSVFGGLCFLWKRNGLAGEFSRADLVRLARECIRTLSIRAAPDDLIDDIVQITNLILEEGGVCAFPHKSVQEFYAASFIAEQTEPRAQSFYAAMRTHWRQWGEELRFLRGLDEYRYLKWFAVPDRLAVLGPLVLPSGEIEMDQFKRLDQISLALVNDRSFALDPILSLSEVHRYAEDNEEGSRRASEVPLRYLALRTPRTSSLNLLRVVLDHESDESEVYRKALEDPDLRTTLILDVNAACDILASGLKYDQARLRDLTSVDSFSFNDPSEISDEQC